MSEHKCAVITTLRENGGKCVHAPCPECGNLDAVAISYTEPESTVRLTTHMCPRCKRVREDEILAYGRERAHHTRLMLDVARLYARGNQSSPVIPEAVARVIAYLRDVGEEI